MTSRALTIAGSDSGGGAGIQADLKTFTALSVYGMAAVTAVTAQDTQGVAAVMPVTPDMVARQIDVVAGDIGVDAAKTGMLLNASIIEAVADQLRKHRIGKLVVDPVLVATSGHPLLDPSAREVLVRTLFPLALLVTPNLPETEVLTGKKIASIKDLHDAFRFFMDLGIRNVLVKGGHADHLQATDFFYDGRQVHEFSAPRLATEDTHGSGCTLSAAIAAYLAQGFDLRDAVFHAKAYVAKAIQYSLRLGKGRGPLNHFWAIKPSRSEGRS